jgi:hypothetical protein
MAHDCPPVPLATCGHCRNAHRECGDRTTALNALVNLEGLQKQRDRHGGSLTARARRQRECDRFDRYPREASWDTRRPGIPRRSPDVALRKHQEARRSLGCTHHRSTALSLRRIPYRALGGSGIVVGRASAYVSSVVRPSLSQPEAVRSFMPCMHYLRIVRARTSPTYASGHASREAGHVLLDTCVSL